MSEGVIVVASIEQTCCGCPSQWEGWTTDQRQVYVRYRWGHLSVRVGEIGDTSDFAGVRGREVVSIQHSDEFDGFLEYDDLKTLCAGKVVFP